MPPFICDAFFSFHSFSLWFGSHIFNFDIEGIRHLSHIIRDLLRGVPELVANRNSSEGIKVLDDHL